MSLLKELLALKEGSDKWEVPFSIRCADTDIDKFKAAFTDELDDLTIDDLTEDEVDGDITHEIAGTVIVVSDSEEGAMDKAHKIVDAALDKVDIKMDEWAVRIDGAYKK